MLNRRNFLGSVVAGSATALLMRELTSAHLSRTLPLSLFSEDDRWAQVPEILKRIKAPVFPQRDFNILRFGAVANGKADCSEAFARAIAACNKAGGGRVLVPSGDFLTGAIHLRSNVNLHLVRGATIKFSQDPRKYLPK